MMFTTVLAERNVEHGHFPCQNCTRSKFGSERWSACELVSISQPALVCSTAEAFGLLPAFQNNSPGRLFKMLIKTPL